MSSNFTVLYDSCVLYPAPLRDLLMQLALTDLFRARWTDEIHDEWIRNVLKNRPDLSLNDLNRTKNLMNLHVRDCLIENYQNLIPTLQLPDPNDRHVLAAAIKGGAHIILTFNLKDFPQSALKSYDIKSVHPDDFILDLINLNPSKIVDAIKLCQQRLKNPPKPMKEYLETLKKQGLTDSFPLLQNLITQSLPSLSLDSVAI